MPVQYSDSYTEDQIKEGYEMVHYGRVESDGLRKNKYISKYYACTSCHNTVREHDDLSTETPDDRLTRAMRENIPFVPGSTFYGVANKSTWYNDDYVLKYGALVEPAKESLAESIQLCAQECSQGRALKEWEIQSILAYYQSISYKLSDLNATQEEMNTLLNEEIPVVVKQDILKALTTPKNAATFGSLPESKEAGYPHEGNVERGQAIYKLGCQHCHRERGESDVVFDDGKVTLKWLERNLFKDSDLSIYQILRKGTYAEKGHKEYMPHYTLEKMSDAQIEDLRAFIEHGAQ